MTKVKWVGGKENAGSSEWLGLPRFQPFKEVSAVKSTLLYFRLVAPLAPMHNNMFGCDGFD